MGWKGLVLVTDAEIGALEPEATHSSRPWGEATWPHARAEAKRDLKIWLERDFADKVPLPSVADRVLDRWSPDWVFGYTGSAYSDLTTSARDDNEEDVDLAAALATFGTDRIYVGALWEFDGVVLHLLDSVNAAAAVVSAKYWSPTGAWVALSIADGTSVGGATLAQSGRVQWTIPSDWDRRRLNGTGEEYYWVELSVSAALTNGTRATQILTVRAPDGLKRVAGWLALAHIMRGLAAGAAEPDLWLQRVSNQQHTGFQDRAEALYASLRDKGGIPIDLNRNETIEAPERVSTPAVRMYRG